MKTLKLLLASILTGFSFLLPALGQDRPPETQPLPLPEGVIARLVVERPDSEKRALRLPAFSPDGRILAAAGDDLQIHLWDIPSRKEIAASIRHGDWIISFVFLPDGKILASSADKTLHLWEVPTGKEISVRKGLFPKLACSQDGTILAASRNDGISLLDPTTLQEIRKIELPEASVFSLAFSPDGKTLAAGDCRGIVHLRDVAQGNEILRFDTLLKRFVDVAWSPDGRRIATATHGRDAYRIWDAATGKEVFRINEGGS